MSDRNKVLLAESDTRAAATLTRTLQSQGIDVVVTNDAVHAMNMARQAKPDVILMNAQLAGGCVAALRRFRSNVYTAHTPVVVLIAASGPS